MSSEDAGANNGSRTVVADGLTILPLTMRLRRRVALRELAICRAGSSLKR